MFEHLENYFSLLRDLKPKSQYKIFHIPLDLSVQTVLRGYGLLKRRGLYGHLQYFTKDIALGALEDVGYEVLDHFYTRAPSISAPGPMEKVLRLPEHSVSQSVRI